MSLSDHYARMGMQGGDAEDGLLYEQRLKEQHDVLWKAQKTRTIMIAESTPSS